MCMIGLFLLKTMYREKRSVPVCTCWLLNCLSSEGPFYTQHRDAPLIASGPAQDAFCFQCLYRLHPEGLEAGGMGVGRASSSNPHCSSWSWFSSCCSLQESAWSPSEVPPQMFPIRHPSSDVPPQTFSLRLPLSCPPSQSPLRDPSSRQCPLRGGGLSTPTLLTCSQVLDLNHFSWSLHHVVPQRKLVLEFMGFFCSYTWSSRYYCAWESRPNQFVSSFWHRVSALLCGPRQGFFHSQGGHARLLMGPSTRGRPNALMTWYMTVTHSLPQ